MGAPTATNHGSALQELSKLGGADRAAILMLTIGEEEAARLLGTMPRQEAEAILHALSRLGRVDQATADAVRREFNALVDRVKKPALVGDPAAARRLFQKAMGNDLSRQEDLMQTFPDDTSQELSQAVAGIAPPILARHLAQEHPQTAALVLAHATPKGAAAVLKILTPEFRTDLLTRIARQSAVAPDVLADLAACLRDLAATSRAATRSVKGGAVQVAALLGSLDAEARDREIAAIAVTDPDLAAEITGLMFVFNDLGKIDDRGFQEILREVAEPDLKLALKGAGPQVAAAFFRNMSSRRATALQEDLAAAPKMKKTDVDAAQRKIAGIAKRLIDEGKISVDSEDESAA